MENDINLYQKQCLKTSQYPEENAIAYCALGLVGEAGEVAGKIKKHIRGDYDLTPEKVEAIADEIGDVLWYAANLAHSIGYNLSDITNKNILKLADRNRRGVIKGDGDNR